MNSARIRWPATQCFGSQPELAATAARCRAAFRDQLRAQRIQADLTPLLGRLYVPLAAWLERRAGPLERALVVGICGPQGSGKSTFAALLKAVLETGFGARVAALSLDDLYLSADRRRRLAREVHPLFATRGVPGTHEVELGIRLIQSLRERHADKPVRIPAFDKARDSRRPERQWPSFEGPADFVIFEGWCVGARPQPEADLVKPVNALERAEDPDGRWRTAVNRALAGPYQSLFELLDVRILLLVEHLAQVLQWRLLQERKLAERHRRAEPAGLRIMSPAEVERFVMHFERLTRHLLAEMPARAEVVLKIDRTHSPAAVRINDPL